MNILVATNHLLKVGGTETFLYALAVSLLRKGHHLEYYATERGAIADKFEELGIRYMSQKRYDLILANHKPVVDAVCERGFTIQTCHGTIASIENPSRCADLYVSVSEAVREHVQTLGKESVVIINGIDCERFRPTSPLHEQLTTVLSLCQSDEAHEFVKRCCDNVGANFLRADKYTDNQWEVEKLINQADLVVGLGRSLYDAMACGRPVICFDNRKYIGKALGDGYLNAENIEESLICNCSGRRFMREYDEESFTDELRKYKKEDGEWARAFALDRLNMDLAADRYLQLYEEAQKSWGVWQRMDKRRKVLYALQKRLFHKKRHRGDQG